MRRCFVALLCFVVTGAAAGRSSFTDADHELKFCNTLDCANRETLMHTIRELRKDIATHTSQLADSTCNACYSNPCQNNGTCVPILPNSYRCDCPDDASGTNCQNKIVCKTNSCGSHATCYVQNHQVNCVCDFGYSGNPKSGCKQSSKKICFNGDPHYATFDDTRYDYQSTCPYIFSKPCTTLTGGYNDFVVKAKNEILHPKDTISYVESTEVWFYNQTIYVDDKLRVYVNGVQVHVPYYYPSADYTKFSVILRGQDIVIRNDQFVEVDFHAGQLCLTVPDVPELQGASTLCGLAGNLDKKCTDDFVLPDGSTLTVPSSCRPSQAVTDNFADAWRITDYTDQEACVDGKTMTNSSKSCDVQNVQADCQAIFHAETGTGPFAACMPLGVDLIQSYYDNCLYDVCRDDNQKCVSLETFAHMCQYALPNANIDGWRDSPEVNCALNCPAHSSYTPCLTSCPATCAQHDAPSSCDAPCADGCACDYGYVLDTTNPSTVTCIPVEQCGCVDDNGNMHPATEKWLSPGCEQNNYCSNGTYVKEKYSCPTYSHCDVADGSIACLCDVGFQYNPTTGQCEDINECLDPTTCSADKQQGACTNTIGSYTCECSQYYVGSNCELYGPMRHCADLYVYYGERADGVYQVSPPYGAVGDPSLFKIGENLEKSTFSTSSSSILVYCDMTTAGGGLMLVGNALTNETAGKSLDDYITGFGDPTKKSIWFGLDLLNLYTNYQPSSLRLNLFRCAHNGQPALATDCTYDQFAVLDKSTDYQVNIPKACSGSEQNFYDGWARWELSQPGPPFLAYDNDNSTAHCSETFQQTGFWYDTSYRCGSANLNGVRYTCDNIPPAGADNYLYWAGEPIQQAELYLRPKGFPDYDKPLNG